MPFWQNVQRCQNCRFWKTSDPSSVTGECMAAVLNPRRPAWMDDETTAVTFWDHGTTCRAYKHDKHKPHPLDDARGRLVTVNPGDVIPMRTYNLGTISHATAKVLRFDKRFVTIELFNAHYRIRLDATEFEKPGTVVGLPDWGIDLAGPIMRAPSRREEPAKAASMLHAIKTGDSVPLIGYPPFDGMRKDARVLVAAADHLTIRIGRRKAKMYRRGALAGIIEGEVWCLDTTNREE